MTIEKNVNQASRGLSAIAELLASITNSLEKIKLNRAHLENGKEMRYVHRIS